MFRYKRFINISHEFDTAKRSNMDRGGKTKKEEEKRRAGGGSYESYKSKREKTGRKIETIGEKTKQNKTSSGTTKKRE